MIVRIGAVVTNGCSREGAGIAEGLAIVMMIIAGVIAAVMLIAIISGAIVGWRKGAIWRQVLRHVLIAGGLLLLVTVVGWVGLGIQSASHADRFNREAIEINAWLAPLADPVPGTLDQVLPRLLDAPAARSWQWRSSLHTSLPQLLAGLDFPLDASDQAALRDAVARIRREDAVDQPGQYGGFHSALDGTVAWLLQRPDLVAALQVCAGDEACHRGALEAAAGWCKRQRPACKDAIDDDDLEAIAAMLRGQRGMHETLQSLRAMSAPSP